MKPAEERDGGERMQPNKDKKVKRTSTITQCAAELGCHFKAFPAINQMLSYTPHPPFPNPDSTSPPSMSIKYLHPQNYTKSNHY